MIAPIRIQRRRMRGWRAPANTISVSRPGRFGNQWRVMEQFGLWYVVSTAGGQAGRFKSEAGARKRAVEMFAHTIQGPELEAARKLLAGSNLMCWCRDAPPGIADRDWCHGGWLCEVVNG